MGMEIERKWLPDRKWAEQVCCGYRASAICQGYLCTQPTVRVRKDGPEYYLTYKGDGQLAREEYNLPLTEKAFLELLPKCEGRVIEKDRYRIPFTEAFPERKETEASVPDREKAGEESRTEEVLCMEIDFFRGRQEGLVLLEIEFPSVEEAAGFLAPAEFGRDVTGEKAYKNAVLAQQ